MYEHERTRFFGNVSHLGKIQRRETTNSRVRNLKIDLWCFENPKSSDLNTTNRLTISVSLDYGKIKQHFLTNYGFPWIFFPLLSGGIRTLCIRIDLLASRNEQEDELTGQYLNPYHFNILFKVNFKFTVALSANPPPPHSYGRVYHLSRLDISGICHVHTLIVVNIICGLHESSASVKISLTI